MTPLRVVAKELNSRIFVKQMIWVGVIWAIAIVTILTNIRFLKTHFNRVVRPHDLFHQLIPQSAELVWLGEICGILGTMCIVYVMWQSSFQRVPKLLFLLAAMYILRSFAINFTPLAQIRPPAIYYPDENIIAQNFYHGMFFSGHTASAFIQVFYIKGHPLRPLTAVLALVQVFTLISTRSHYTIDIVGGFFVAYFFTHFDFMCLVPHRLRDVSWMPWNPSSRQTMGAS